ncbi:MAG: hypothetical protein IJY22_06785 [Clostridia bacterium]|nr:hypothetical protein [Clostridia bacterium]
MELYQEVLTYMFGHLNTSEQREALGAVIREGVNAQCFRILQEIRAVVRDTTLEDPQCFEKIEQIVSIFEQYALDAGARHDFG